MSERRLGECRDYQELVNLLRAWLAEIGTTFETLDDVSGVTNGYSSKLLAPTPMKGLGKTSMGPILGALGLKLIVAIDQEQLARIRPRLTPRCIQAAMLAVSPLIGEHRGSPAEFMRIIAPRGADMRNYNLSSKQRVRLARKAARVRWGR